jgi:tetratricopeptide (TPR) repeat protein
LAHAGRSARASRALQRLDSVAPASSNPGLVGNPARRRSTPLPHADRRGLPLSTASDDAAAHYRDGVDLLLSTWPGAEETLDRAIGADPDFALAHAALARLHATRGEAEQAKVRAASARERVARRGTERERSHVEAIALGIEGQPAQALRQVLAHLESWPRDAVILALALGAFGLFAFSGRADHDQARVDLCERLARHYGDGDWWFLTYHGWSHTENGDVTRGRALTQRAFELRPENANAAHALAHAMFEDGSIADAEALISDWLPGYGRPGPLYSHLAWHRALLALENDNPDRALAIFRCQLRPARTVAAPLIAVSDSAALLWRLRISGHDIPKEHAGEAAGYAARAFPAAGFAFADVHVALIAAVSGDRDALQRRIAAVESRVAADAVPAGPVVPALCRAVLAFAEEDYAACVRLLEPVAADVARIGGSHAQRQVFEDTLIVALLRSGEAAKAHALIDRRLRRRPSPRDLRWRTMTV